MGKSSIRTAPQRSTNCSLSLWRVARGSKHMFLELIHGFKQSLGYQQHSFWLLLLCIFTTNVIQTFQPFFIYTNTDYNIHGAFPLLFASPCRFPFAPLSISLLLTWNPPSCDRIRPPRSQVDCKLTSPVPTLFPNPPPSKFPEPQFTQRLTKTTSGIIRRLLSGTLTIESTAQDSQHQHEK